MVLDPSKLPQQQADPRHRTPIATAQSPFPAGALRRGIALLELHAPPFELRTIGQCQLRVHRPLSHADGAVGKTQV